MPRIYGPRSEETKKKMSESMRGKMQRKVNWDSFSSLSEALAHQVKDAYFAPSMILAIGRGGVFLGGQLSYDLNIKELVVCNIRAYDDLQVNRGPYLLHKIPPKLLKTREILVVDEICDTGSTLRFLKDFLLTETTCTFKMATLFYKRRSTIVPDFFAKRTHDSSWITFPWEREI